MRGQRYEYYISFKRNHVKKYDFILLIIKYLLSMQLN
jgi:hypothetical protein